MTGMFLLAEFVDELALVVLFVATASRVHRGGFQHGFVEKTHVGIEMGPGSMRIMMNPSLRRQGAKGSRGFVVVLVLLIFCVGVVVGVDSI